MIVLSGKVENCRTFEPSLSLGRDLFETTAKVERFVSSPQDSTHSGCSELEKKKSVNNNKLLNKYYCPHKVVEGAVLVSRRNLLECKQPPNKWRFGYLTTKQQHRTNFGS